MNISFDLQDYKDCAKAISLINPHGFSEENVKKSLTKTINNIENYFSNKSDLKEYERYGQGTMGYFVNGFFNLDTWEINIEFYVKPHVVLSGLDAL